MPLWYVRWVQNTCGWMIDERCFRYIGSGPSTNAGCSCQWAPRFYGPQLRRARVWTSTTCPSSTERQRLDPRVQFNLGSTHSSPSHSRSTCSPRVSCTFDARTAKSKRAWPRIHCSTDMVNTKALVEDFREGVWLSRSFSSNQNLRRVCSAVHPMGRYLSNHRACEYELELCNI